MRGQLATPTRVSLCPPGPHCRQRVYCSFRSDVRDASAIRRVEGSALLSCALCAQGGGDNALYTQLATPRIPLFRELTCAEPCVILPFYRCLHCSLPVCCAARRRQSCLCKQFRSSGTVFILERGKALCPGSMTAPAVGGDMLNPSRSYALSLIISRDLKSVRYALTNAWLSV